MAPFTGTTFPLFRDFPAEVRYIIWEVAIRPLPVQRVVDLRFRPVKDTTQQPRTNMEVKGLSSGCNRDLQRSDNATTRHRNNATFTRGATADTSYQCKEQMTLGIRSPLLPPGAMFACKEAYGIGSMYYQKAFASSRSIAQTYFNLNQDIAYFRFDKIPNYNSMESIADEIEEVGCRDFKAVQHLAISMDPDENYDTDLESFLARLLFIFTDLKDLHLIVEHYGNDYYDDLDPVSIIGNIDLRCFLAWYDCFESLDCEICTHEDIDEMGVPETHLHPLHWLSEVDFRELQNLLSSRDHRSGRRTAIPNIKISIALPKWLETDFEKKQKECEEASAEIFNFCNELLWGEDLNLDKNLLLLENGEVDLYDYIPETPPGLHGADWEF